MESKGVCSMKGAKPEEGGSGSYMLEVTSRGCSQKVTRMVAYLEKVIVMEMEKAKEMEMEINQRSCVVSMMTAEHPLLYQIQSD
jgi:hypothetical protein